MNLNSQVAWMILIMRSGAKSMDEAIGMAKMDTDNSPYTDELRFSTTAEQVKKYFQM